MTTSTTAGAYELLRGLYPGLPVVPSAERALRPVPSQVRRFLAVPDLDDTRMFLPAAPRLAASSLRRARRAVGLKGRLTTATATLALRSGSTHVLRRHVTVPVTDDSVDVQLADILGHEVQVAVFLGPPRANRKPVLQVMDTTGALLSITKMGVSALSSALADNEVDALRTLARHRLDTVVVPRLLGELHRQGHTGVAQSPLDVPVREATPSAALIHAAVLEISGVEGTTTGSFAASLYLRDLRERLAALPDVELRSLGAAVLADVASADPMLTWGAWHGDFSPWNVAASSGRLLVWDWERFSHHAPVGYDALHYEFMPLLKNVRLDQHRVGLELMARAPRVLQPAGVEQDAAATVALLYLVEVAVRFLGDGQAATGVLGGDVERWVLPVLRDHLAKGRK